MKIGIDARSAMLYKKGGFGVYTRNLIKSMALLNPQHCFDLKYQRKIEHKFNTLQNITTQKLYFPFDMFWTQLRLPVHFLKYKPDIFLFPGQTISPFSSIKKVVTIHDLRFKAVKNQNKKEYYRLNLQIKNCIKYSDQIICVSNKTKSDLINYYSVNDAKINVVYHGADHIKETNENTNSIKSEDLFKKYNITKDYLLTVGYTHKHKSIISVIYCLSNLVKNGYDLNLVIAGPAGDDEKNIQNKIKELRLNKRVIRIPYVESKYLGAMYHFSKLFIYPSKYEGFGFPILESMRSGCPVLGSNNGSIEEIGGNSMIYFKDDKLEDLITKAKEILSNEKLRDSLKIKGYKNARNFSWENTAKRTMQILES